MQLEWRNTSGGIEWKRAAEIRRAIIIATNIPHHMCYATTFAVKYEKKRGKTTSGTASPAYGIDQRIEWKSESVYYVFALFCISNNEQSAVRSQCLPATRVWRSLKRFSSHFDLTWESNESTQAVEGVCDIPDEKFPPLCRLPPVDPAIFGLYSRIPILITLHYVINQSHFDSQKKIPHYPSIMCSGVAIWYPFPSSWGSSVSSMLLWIR